MNFLAPEDASILVCWGLLDGLLARWGMQRKEVLLAQLSATERRAAVNGLIRFLRLSMQSLTLGLGAYLAIERSITPGQMFAATILLARALQHRIQRRRGDFAR